MLDNDFQQINLYPLKKYDEKLLSYHYQGKVLIFPIDSAKVPKPIEVIQWIG